VRALFFCFNVLPFPVRHPMRTLHRNLIPNNPLSGRRKCRILMLARHSWLIMSKFLPSFRQGLLAAAVLLCTVCSSHASDRYWSVTTGDWSTPANWGGVVPISGDLVYVVNDGTATITQAGAKCSLLNLGIGSGVQLSSGGLAASSERIAGTFTHSGGTNSLVGTYGSLRVGTDSGATGVYDLSGTGVLSVTDSEYIGAAGSGIFNQSGGTNNAVTVFLGFNESGPSSDGTYNLSGGQLFTQYLSVGYRGTGTFNQSGGTNTISRGLTLANTTPYGTYNLTGGTLIVPSITSGSEQAAFNFGGGTLQANGAFSTTVPMTLTGIGGDAKVNTAGYAVTLAGVLSGPGGLNKLGANTLTLSGANSYTGGTRITEGTVQLGNANAAQNSTVYVGTTNGLAFASGIGTFNLGALAGSSDFVLTDSGNNAITLRAGRNNASTIYSGAMSGNGGLTKVGTGVLDLSGANTYTGTTTVSDGILRLSHANALPGGTQATGGTGNLNIAGGVVELTRSNMVMSRNLGTGAGQVQFTGSGGFSAYSDDPNVSVTPGVRLNGGATLTWGSGGFVPNGCELLLSSSQANGTVDFQNPIDVGGSPRTVRVADGSAEFDAYLSGAISGTGGLIKAGDGTLSLGALTYSNASANTYAGPTVVAGGVLALNNTLALPGGIGATGGTSNLTLAGGVLQLKSGQAFSRSLGTGASQVQFTGNGGFSADGSNCSVNLGGASAEVRWSESSFVPSGSRLLLGANSSNATLDFQNPIDFGSSLRTVEVRRGSASADAKLSGSLRGTAGFEKSGSGILELTASNSYSGPTVVSGGVLGLDNANAIPGGIGVSGGASNLVIAGGVVELHNADFYRGLGTGPDQVQFTGSGGFSGSIMNSSNQTRIVNLGGQSAPVTWGTGGFVPDGATFILGASGAGGFLDFQNPINLGNSARIIQVDGVSPYNALPPLGCAILSGGVTGNGGLTKSGDGVLRLSTANDYGGETRVTGGVLQLANPQSLPGGIGATGGRSHLSVNGGGTIGLDCGDFKRNLGSGPEDVQFSGSGGFVAGSYRFVNFGGASAPVVWNSNPYLPDDFVLYLESANPDGPVDLQNPLVLGPGKRTVSTSAGSGDVHARLSGSISGVGGLKKEGTLVLDLTAANSYTGETEIHSGVLRLSNDRALPGGIAATGGTSNLNFTGSPSNSWSSTSNGTFSYATGGRGPTLELAAGDLTRGLGTGPSQVQFTGNGGFSAYGANRAVNLGGNSSQVVWGQNSFVPTDSTLCLSSDYSNATIDFQNPIDLGTSARTVNVANGTAVVDAKLSGILSGSGALWKTGNGTLELTAANAYTGQTLVQQGILRLGSPLALPGGIGATGGTSNLSLQGGVIELASDNFYRGVGTGPGQVQFGSGGFAAVGATRVVNLGGSSAMLTTSSSSPLTLTLGSANADATLDFQNPINFAFFSQAVEVNDGSAAVDAKLSGVLSGSGGLRKTHSGTLQLTAANTYTGKTWLWGGALRLSNAQALPGGCGVTGGTSNLDFYGGVLELASGDFLRGVGTGASQVQFSALEGGFAAVGANRVVNLGGSSAPITWGSNGFAPWTLVLGSPNANATVDFQNPLNLGASFREVRVDNGSAAIDGKLSGVLSGTGGVLTKSGAGTLALTANNTYTGRTMVNAGKLIVSGALGNTAVTVYGGASLAGTGSIAGSLAVAGGNSAGSRGVLDFVDGSIGTLTLSNSVASNTVLTLGGDTAGSFSTLNFELGTTADRILLSAGKVAVNPGGAVINISPLASVVPGTYDLFNFASGQASGLDRLTLGSVPIPGRYRFSLQTTATAEQLVISGTPADLAIPVTYAGSRIAQSGTGNIGNSTIAVTTPGNVDGNFTLSSSTLTATPTSGTVAANATDPVPFSFRWTDMSTTGLRSGVITLTNPGNPADPNNHQMSVSGAVVANRTLTVAAIGAPQQRRRLMIDAPISRMIASGNNDTLDDDNHATRVDTVGGGAATNGNVSVTYQGAPRTTFNGTNQNADLAVRFAESGLAQGSIDLAPALLSNGEADSVGAIVQPVNLEYNAAVLANRQLMVAPVGGARSLRVMVANPLATTTTVRSGADPVAEDDNHATRVNTVAGGAATDGYATVRYQGSPRSTFNGANQNASVGVSFARDSQPGSHHGSLDLAPSLLTDGEDASVGAAVESAVLDYDVSVLANRQLTVGALGTAGQPARVVLRCPRTTTISTGNDPLLDSDAAATRVNTVANGRASATDFNRMLVTYHGTPRAQFNGAGQSAEIDVLFNKTGRVKTTYDLSHELLKNGEADSVGATLQSANLSLDVNILTPRRLTATQRTVSFGNVLRGASVAGAFTLKTADSHPDSDHATMVYVAPGGTPLGELTAVQTFVSGGGMVKVPVTGRLSTYGNGVTKGVLPIATAEAPEVQDTTRYKSLAVQYKANVGLAKFGRSASFGSGETVLSASVADGSRLANFAAGESLSSKVNPKGTLAENPSLATSITTTASLKGIYSGVGSEAEIVDSTEVDAGTTVTMQWRSRSRSESHAPRTPVDSALPSGAWLASDVVKISGIASSVTYALNMSFDNRINLALDGPVNGTVESEFSSGHLYLTEYDSAARRWLNAGDGEGNFASLADFLTDHSGAPLTDLVGSWGVDPLTSATGIGHAWAIVGGGGSGIFAVDPGIGGVMTANVPEPSVIALLISAAAAWIAFRTTARKMA
jgi:autotransporter-associated beta strand protein